MRNKKLEDMANFFKVEPKDMRIFYIDQIERCRELLIEATKTAARGENEKPVFYTALRRKTRSGRTQAFSIHYFNHASGEMQSLNYVVSILLNLRLDEQERYVVARTNEFQNGDLLISSLSKWVIFGKYQRTNHFAAKVI